VQVPEVSPGFEGDDDVEAGTSPPPFASAATAVRRLVPDRDEEPCSGQRGRRRPDEAVVPVELRLVVECSLALD
jgi:hypothetical protein